MKFFIFIIMSIFAFVLFLLPSLVQAAQSMAAAGNALQ